MAPTGACQCVIELPFAHIPVLIGNRKIFPMLVLRMIYGKDTSSLKAPPS